MSYIDQNDKLAGPIALLKSYAYLAAWSPGVLFDEYYLYRFVSHCGRETADDAVQIFGGRSITMTGMGKLIENVRVCGTR